MKKVIGLVGEDPNDTKSIGYLLQKRFKDIAPKQLLKNIRGHQLDNARTRHALIAETKQQCPAIIVVIRDLDEVITHTDKIKEKQEWYRRLTNDLPCQTLLLLNIYELEALIFADIATFNKDYGTKIKDHRDVAYINKPKEALKMKTQHSKKVFHESHCPQIFEQLDVNQIIRNCKYFRDFITELAKHLEN